MKTDLAHSGTLRFKTCDVTLMHICDGLNTILSCLHPPTHNNCLPSLYSPNNKSIESNILQTLFPHFANAYTKFSIYIYIYISPLYWTSLHFFGCRKKTSPSRSLSQKDINIYIIIHIYIYIYRYLIDYISLLFSSLWSMPPCIYILHPRLPL